MKKNGIFYLSVCSFLLLAWMAVAQPSKGLRFVEVQEVEEGDGAVVKRLIPQRHLKHYDPYVLLDDFTISPPHGFPDHFHSGFEVITYVVQGKLQHKDSQGNTEVLEAGDVQCFTTGSGVVHSEMPQGEEQVKGFQIWINLPKEFKSAAPGYQLVREEQIPVVKLSEQVRIKELVAQGATVHTKAEVLIREISIAKGGKYAVALPAGYAGVMYVSEGAVDVEGKIQKSGQAVLFDAQQLQLSAVEDSKLLLVSGLPLQEPIRRRGAIVK